MRAPRWAAVTAICIGVSAAPLTAQVSLGVAGLMAALGGDDFELADNGFGGEVSVWFPAGTSFTIGGGAHYTSHGLDGTDESLSVVGIFVEPRYRFQAGGTVKPYVAARVAWARESATTPLGDASATGFYFGAGGGLMIPVGAKVDLDFELLFNAVSFGDVELDGSTQSNTDSNGTALVARVGIVFRLGS
ncbi:MAG: outer membrane beta-barrel protein [Gemmatimonadales bacterium]